MTAIIGPGGPQGIVDFLDDMLRAGRAPALRALMALAPFEPLGPPEGLIMVQKRGVGWVEGVRQRWPKSMLERHERFPGYQGGHRYRESLKYGCGFELPGHDMPEHHAPLASFVRKRLQHALAKWSGQIDAGCRLQFIDWLPLHLDFRAVGDGGPLWPDHEGGWARSYQLLRLACGLPRFPSSRSRRA